MPGTYISPAETGFYYLENRYYDYEIGRFISQDEQLLLDNNMDGTNLYTYCGNNPIVRIDSTGQAWETIFDIGSLAASVAEAIANPRNAWNWIGVIGDVVDLIPVVSGVGEGIRAAKTVDAVDDVADVARTANKADNVKDIATGVCFVAGTSVLTANGYSAIEDICVGDKVWSENPKTGETELKEVVQTFVNETDELIHVHVNGEEIITTPEHPFYVPNQGWTASVHLRAGDILVLRSGEYVIVEMIQHEILESPVTVYNFEVEDFHTYYVGTSSVLVHNACGVRNTPDQDALIQIVKNAKKAGLTRDEADIVWEWTEEVGLSGMKNYHPPKFDSYQGGNQLHMKINGMHINIFE